MGVQEPIIPAAVAPMVSPARRASAYGLFTGIYGTAWVAGSIIIGALFNVTLTAIVVAHREATEEIWPVPPYRVTSIEVQDCGGGWKFHIFHADTDEPFTAYTAGETDSTGWFTLSEMRTLRLHPGFRPGLRAYAAATFGDPVAT